MQLRIRRILTKFGCHNQMLHTLDRSNARVQPFGKIVGPNRAGRMRAVLLASRAELIHRRIFERRVCR